MGPVAKLAKHLPNKSRLERHKRLALLSALLLLIFFFGLKLSPEMWVEIPEPKAESLKWRASMSFAYVSLLFLCVTLLIGPYYVLTKRPRPANIFLRRDIAIWAGALALAHTSFSMFIHVRGWRFWDNFIRRVPSLDNPFPIKPTTIGLANYIGLLQLGIIVLLLILSNNRALRRLGSKRWKNLQRLSYLAFAAIAVHGLLYHLVERRLWSFRLPVYGLILLVVLVQLAGFFYYRRRQNKIKERKRNVESISRELKDGKTS